MNKVAFYMILVTLFSKVLGFLRDIFLSYFYGVSYISDAYLVSIMIPTVVFALLGTGINSGFIPIFSKLLYKNGKNVADKFTNNMVNFYLLISSVLLLLGIFFTPYLIYLFASGFTGDTLELTVLLTRISFISIYFWGLVYIYSGYLQTQSIFVSTSLVGIPMNVIYLLSIFISVYCGPTILGVGIVVAAASQLIILIPSLKKTNYKYRFYFKLSDKNLKKSLLLMLPIMIGVSVNQVNTIIDRSLASNIIEGGVSALTFGDRINVLIQGVFVITLVTIIFPYLVRKNSQKNIEDFKKIITNSLLLMVIIILPLMLFSLQFSMQIITFLFARGQFDNSAVELTSSALFYYSIGMLAYAFRELLSRAFFALEDSKTPMINSSIGMLLNIFLNLLLVVKMGISGLALATSISGWIIASLLICNLWRRIGIFFRLNDFLTVIKILISACSMYVINYCFYDWSVHIINDYISLILTFFLGILIYVLSLMILKVDFIKIFTQFNKI